jgi:hypothetical protein
MNTSRNSRSVYESIQGLAGRAVAAYRRRQDAYALEAFPDDIRADIGLPRMDQFGRAGRPFI